MNRSSFTLARRLASRLLLCDAPRPMPSRDTWQQEYQSGQWQHLWSDEELPRYAILANYLRVKCPQGALLDLGCGEGILCDRLWPASYSRYVGVDLSAAAIERGKQCGHVAAEYLCADVEQYVLAGDAQFDAIIFNEVLYYFADPVAVVSRFARSLKPGGILLASLFEPSMKSIRKSIRQIEQSAAWTQTYSVTHEESGKTWSIKAWGVEPNAKSA